MEDGEEAEAEDGWLSILIATSSPSIAQWANIVQNLLCHSNSAKGLCPWVLKCFGDLPGDYFCDLTIFFLYCLPEIEVKN